VSGARTLVSAVCIVLGSLLIAVWAASWVALSALENGTVVDSAAATAIDSPVVREQIASAMGDQAVAALGRAGVDTAAPGLEVTVRAALTAAARSSAFGELLASQISVVREQFVAALQDSDADGRPITVSINVTDFFNEKMSSAPVVGSLLPNVTVPPVSVEVLGAQKADDARRAYDWMTIAATWFLWLGLGVLALGIVVSHRRRWFLAKVSLAIAAMSAGAWAILTFVDPATIIRWLPGGSGGAASGVVSAVIAAEAGPSLARRMAIVAIAAMVVAGILFALALALASSARPPRELRK